MFIENRNRIIGRLNEQIFRKRSAVEKFVIRLLIGSKLELFSNFLKLTVAPNSLIGAKLESSAVLHYITLPGADNKTKIKTEICLHFSFSQYFQKTPQQCSVSIQRGSHQGDQTWLFPAKVATFDLFVAGKKSLGGNPPNF